PPPFPRIAFEEAMLRYGTDKPDLRNPLLIADVSDVFRDSGFSVFAKLVAQGGAVRAIPAPGTAGRPRSFFDRMNDWARDQGAPGLGYIVLGESEARGPIAKFLDADRLARLKHLAGVGPGDAVFFAAGKAAAAAKLAGQARDRLGHELELIEPNAFRFCWLVDFPMYELDEATGKIEFSHN